MPCNAISAAQPMDLFVFINGRGGGGARRRTEDVEPVGDDEVAAV